MNKEENQQKVIAAINNGFTIFFDRGGFTILDEYLMPTDSVGYENVENFAEIFAATKEYIRNRPHEFGLGGSSGQQNVCEGYLKDQRPEDRPWWSPLLIVEEEEINHGRSIGPHDVARTRKIMKGNFFIHPVALTGAQYEELKQLIPGACKVRGCCNNYPDPVDFYSSVTYSMAGDTCWFHYMNPDHRPPFFPGKTCGDNFGTRENNNINIVNNQQQIPPPIRTRVIRNSLPFVIDLRQHININYPPGTSERIGNLILENLNAANMNSCGLDNLERIEFLNNNLAKLNIYDLRNLKEIRLSSNSMTNLSIYNLQNLKEIQLSYNSMNKIMITDCPNLKKISLADNNMNKITITNCDNLEKVRLVNNNFHKINIQDECYSFIEVSSNCTWNRPIR